MSYEADYTSAQKTYWGKIKALEPTPALKLLVEDKRSLALTKMLDERRKNSEQLKPALLTYVTYCKKYVEAIDKQIKEKEQEDKRKNLRTPLPTYVLALHSIGTRCSEELRKLEAAPKTLQAISNGATAAAAVGAIKQVSAEFKRRKQEYLDATVKVLKYSTECKKRAGMYHNFLKSGLERATQLASNGKIKEAGSLEKDMENELLKLQAAAGQAGEQYKLFVGKYDKWRNLSGILVAKDLGLEIPKQFHNDMVKALDQYNQLFTSATANTVEAIRLNKECGIMASDGEDLVAKIKHTLEGKDLGELYEAGARKVAVTVKEMLETPLKRATGLQSSWERFSRNVKTLTEGVNLVKTGNKEVKQEEIEQERRSAQNYINTMTPETRKKMDECKKAEVMARELIANEKKKIPPQLLQGEILEVLTFAEQQFVDKLHQLNEENAKFNGVLEKAQSLIK